jgi:hypothetical protein
MPQTGPTRNRTEPFGIPEPDPFLIQIQLGTFQNRIQLRYFRIRNPELVFFKQSMGARNRVGIGLSYRNARLHRLAEFISWNRFLGSINV